MRLRRLCFDIFALRRFFSEPMVDLFLASANGSTFHKELQVQMLKSGWWDLNPRPPAPEAGALPS